MYIDMIPAERWSWLRFDWVVSLWKAWGRRRRFSMLLNLDDHLLEDIGATRGEVEDLLDEPLDVNAAFALREMSKIRRAIELSRLRL